MLDDKRIKEAEKNTKDYLEDGLISKIAVFRKEIFDTYKRNYKESYAVSERLLSDNLSSLWWLLLLIIQCII